MDESDTRTHKRPYTVYPNQGFYARKEIPLPGKASMYNILHVIDKLSIRELVDDLEKLALSYYLLRRKQFRVILLFGWPCPAGTGNIKWRFGPLSNSKFGLIVNHFGSPSPFVLLRRRAIRCHSFTYSVSSRSSRRISIEKICNTLSNIL